MKSEHLIDALATQGWYIWDDFLSLKQVQEIKLAIPQQLTDARIGNGEKLQENKNIRGDQTLWLEPEMGEPIALYMDKMEELRQLINRQLYLGLRDFETHYCRYPQGTFYKKHCDNFQGKGLRKVTTVLYLNEFWQSGDGGELAMFNNDDQQLATIDPIGGRLVIFMSEDFPHEVLPTKTERCSIAGWFLSQKVF